MVRRETSYNNQLNLIYSKLKVNKSFNDVKKLLSMSPTIKFIDNRDDNDDLEASFDEYFNRVTHIVMIYVKKIEKYMMKILVKDGGEENMSKVSNKQPDIGSQLQEERAQ